MPTCSITGCTSGYRSNRNKSHFFTVPRDPRILEKWKTAIVPSGTGLKPGQSVCEKHFNPNEIVWQPNHLAPDGTLLGVTRYKVPGLQKGSVSSKFPWTDIIMTHEETLAAAPLHEDAAYPGVPRVENCEFTNDFLSTSEGAEDWTEFSASASDPASQNSGSENTPVSPPPITFEQLMASELSIPPRWTKQNVTHEHTKLIVYYHTKCAKIKGKLFTFILKEIIVKADMTFQINVLEKPVEEKDLEIDISPLCSVQRLQDLLVFLSGFNICTGTRLFNQEYRAGSAVYRDPSGTWRHVKCSLLLSSTLGCSSCRIARKSMITKCRRVKKSSNATGCSEDKSVLAKLKVKCRSPEKIAARAKAEIAKLKSTLDECERKVSNSAKSLEQYIEPTRVPESQMLALQEIVAAAKCEDPRGRRYSEEWLLFFMLPHMRSPAGYNFSHKNEILPLRDV